MGSELELQMLKDVLVVIKISPLMSMTEISLTVQKKNKTKTKNLGTVIVTELVVSGACFMVYCVDHLSLCLEILSLARS